MSDIDVSQMTPEQRLKQIEIILSTAGKKIAENTESIKATQELLFETIKIFNRQQINIEAMQAEIRASQAECQRIWEYLTTQNRNGNSPQ